MLNGIINYAPKVEPNEKIAIYSVNLLKGKSDTIPNETYLKYYINKSVYCYCYNVTGVHEKDQRI